MGIHSRLFFSNRIRISAEQHFLLRNGISFNAIVARDSVHPEGTSFGVHRNPFPGAAHFT